MRVRRAGRLLSRGALAVATLLPTAGACDSLTGACTQIGCTSGLLLHLESQPVGDFSVNAWAAVPDQPPTYSAVCSAGVGNCSKDIFFAGLIAPRLWIRVTTPDGTVLHELYQHEYTEQFPNGRRCGAACRVAEATVGLP